MFLSHRLQVLRRVSRRKSRRARRFAADAGTRVARYVVQELGGHAYKPFGDLRSLSGNIIASLNMAPLTRFLQGGGPIIPGTVFPFVFISIACGALSGFHSLISSGTANQLLGMLALCIGTTVIIKLGKVKYIWVTLLPMVFMATTTFTAAGKLIVEYSARAAQATPEAFTYRINEILIGAMVILACIILVDSLIKWYRFFVKNEPFGMPVAAPDTGMPEMKE